MAQVIVRNLDEAVKRKLQRRAARHGRSMEEEVRDILRDAAKMRVDEIGRTSVLRSRRALRALDLRMAFQNCGDLRSSPLI